MIAALICRRRGHDVHPDPGDFVLICQRCGRSVDLYPHLSANTGPRPSRGDA